MHRVRTMSANLYPLSWKGCKEYVVAAVPQLRRYNGDEVTKSMRIEAEQNLEVLLADLRIEAAKNIEKKKHTAPNENAYTPENRVKMAREAEEEKKKQEEENKKNSMFAHLDLEPKEVSDNF